jgi:hypothetical protein
MEEYIYQIRKYLPIEFAEQETNEFVDYLFYAYLENIKTEKYQFSFTAFHMLYMSYIYKVKWLLKEQGNSKINESLTNYISGNKDKKVELNTLFDLSLLPEKTALEKLLNAFNFHANDIAICKNLVEVRNNCSHASGKIYYKRSIQIENYVLEEMDNITAIQSKIKPQLKSNLEKFITDFWEENWIEGCVKEWIISNYLSEQDIVELLKLKMPFFSQLSDNREVILKKLLYCNLVYELTSYVENKDNYFLKSLQILMNGLIGEVDIRKNTEDEPKLKSTRELIEERILPLLAELPSEDLKKGQKILKIDIIDD